MTIYWRIGTFVLGLYVIFQLSLWVAHQFYEAPEIIQNTGQTLLDRHLQQRLPEHYYKVSQAKEVWPAPFFSEPSANELLDTLHPGTLITILDSISGSDSSESQWLKVAYQDGQETDHSGWITYP
jgi:hypothetical protein